MSWKEVLAEIATKPVAIALGLAGDVDFAGRLVVAAGAIIYKWTAGDDEVYTSDGRREYRCGVCGNTGHNRRSCNENEVCDCGNKEADNIWKYEGKRVCDQCT